jgi:hypothetical protein
MNATEPAALAIPLLRLLWSAPKKIALRVILLFPTPSKLKMMRSMPRCCVWLAGALVRHVAHAGASYQHLAERVLLQPLSWRSAVPLLLKPRPSLPIPPRSLAPRPLQTH